MWKLWYLAGTAVCIAIPLYQPNLLKGLPAAMFFGGILGALGYMSNPANAGIIFRVLEPQDWSDGAKIKIIWLQIAIHSIPSLIIFLIARGIIV